MDIDLLKTFLEIHQTRHFGKAADNLFLTQSTVSSRIHQLEEVVGASLFTRTRNDIRLTPAGERLLKYAENIIITWNRAQQEIAVDNEDVIPFNIAGVPSLWDIVLQEWLHQLARGNSELAIHADVFTSDIIVRRLLDNTLDLGFAFEAPQHSALAYRQIMSVPLILVSTVRGSTLEMAMENDYVLVDWGNSFATAHARHFPNIPSPAMRLGRGRMALDYLLECGGSAYMAEPMVNQAIKRKKLYKVKNAPVIERSASAIYDPNSDRIDTILQLLTYFT
jgi:DNA-binding transcriptional LysR family regulator